MDWYVRCPLLPGPTVQLTHTTFFPYPALLTLFSPGTLLDRKVTLIRLSGAKSLHDLLFAQLLAGWVASSPLAMAKGGGSEATEVGYPTFTRTKRRP